MFSFVFAFSSKLHLVVKPVGPVRLRSSLQLEFAMSFHKLFASVEIIYSSSFCRAPVVVQGLFCDCDTISSDLLFLKLSSAP